MKENQEISHKQVEYQFQDSIKNFGSLSMVDDGEKIGDFLDSIKKENQELSRDKQGEFQFQDSIKNNFGSLSMVDDGKKIGDFLDSTKKDKLSRDKQGEFQFEDSINNFESLSMVDGGEKIGDFLVSTKKENQELSRDKRGEYQYQDSIKNFGPLSMVDDGDQKIGDFSIESKKLGLSGRDKLKRHWREVGDRVLVPEKWGHEGSLREWMDYSSFDKILAPKGLKSAREALISQGKRARSGSTSTSSSRMLKIRSR